MAYIDVYQAIADYLGVSLKIALILMTVLTLWGLIWKGFALWKSSRKNQPIWFIVLLVVNTVGILEILYIFIFSKLKDSKPKKKEVRNKKSGRKR